MKCVKAILCLIVLLFLATIAEAGRLKSPCASCAGGVSASTQASESAAKGWPWTPAPKPAPAPLPEPAPVPSPLLVVEVPVSAEVAESANAAHPLARVAIRTAGRSVAVVAKIAAAPIRAVAKLGKAIRGREHKPIARLVGRLIRR